LKEETLVKICGITNTADAREAQSARADLIGFVFIPASKRYISPAQAREILSADETLVRNAVGLFQNEELENVVETVNALGIRIVQLHGQESPEYLDSLAKRLPGCRFIKAILIRRPEDIEMIDFYSVGEPSPFRSQLLAILLDSAAGGMGKAFDWQKVAEYLKGKRSQLPPIFLAGGLGPENVAEAIRVLEPDGVDVSSGVEASPGKKDAVKIRDFICRAKGWNCRPADLKELK
jgi:phosphoribosylanthranilate isomerase